MKNHFSGIRYPSSFYYSRQNENKTAKEVLNNIENAANPSQNFHPVDSNEEFSFDESYLYKSGTLDKEKFDDFFNQILNCAPKERQVIGQSNQPNQPNQSVDKAPAKCLDRPYETNTDTDSSSDTGTDSDGDYVPSCSRDDSEDDYEIEKPTRDKKRKREDDQQQTYRRCTPTKTSHTAGSDYLEQPSFQVAKFKKKEMNFFRSFKEKKRTPLDQQLLSLLKEHNASVTPEKFKRFVACAYAAMLFLDFHEQDRECQKVVDALFDCSMKIWNLKRQSEKEGDKEMALEMKNVLLNQRTPVGVADIFAAMFERRAAELKGRPGIGIQIKINHAQKMLKEFRRGEIMECRLPDVTWLEFLKETSPDNQQLDKLG